LNGSPMVGTPHELFEVADTAWAGFAPFADGQRFALVERPTDLKAAKINVVMNWTAGLL